MTFPDHIVELIQQAEEKYEWLDVAWDLVDNYEGYAYVNKLNEYKEQQALHADLLRMIGQEIIQEYRKQST